VKSIRRGNLITLIQGDNHVIREEGVVLATILGSCVSACLFDPLARIGGMNHFLLPDPGPGAIDPMSAKGYGVHAMELLINAMMQAGASRSRLRAHLYGGANMIERLGRIGSANAEFARGFLATEGIELVHEDLEGQQARRVQFIPTEGKARCSRIAIKPDTVEQPLPSALPTSGDVDLF